jgi:glycosyltransferase involved in cell wall biosynthesis
MANQTRQLAGLLEQAGVPVEIVRFNAPYRPSWIGSLRGVRALFRLLPYLRNLWNAAGRVDLFHVMANSGWAWHLCAAPAIWIAKLRGIPVVVNYRGGEAETFFSRSFLWVGPTLRAADALVVPSRFLEQVFARFGLTPGIVPNIVDVSRFTPRPLPLASSTHEPHVIVTRNLEAIYDVGTGIRAFALVRDVWPAARLTIAGEGPERTSLEQLVSSLGLAGRVTFTGRLDNLGIEALYREADLFLNPSLVDNTPISLLEAMASAVPVVSTNVGGVPFMVEDGKSAWLVPPGDVHAMAHAMIDLLRDREKATRFTQAGRECVEQYTWQNVRPRLLNVYRRLTAGTLRNVAAPAE